jgi:hypothetical protein
MAGRGNERVWKAWKAKGRLPILPTLFGNPCGITTFPPPRRRRKVFRRNDKDNGVSLDPRGLGSVCVRFVRCWIRGRRFAPRTENRDMARPAARIVELHEPERYQNHVRNCCPLLGGWMGISDVPLPGVLCQDQFALGTQRFRLAEEHSLYSMDGSYRTSSCRSFLNLHTGHVRLWVEVVLTSNRPRC